MSSASSSAKLAKLNELVVGVTALAKKSEVEKEQDPDSWTEEKENQYQEYLSSLQKAKNILRLNNMPIDDDSDGHSNLAKKRTREDDENGDGGRPKKVVCRNRTLEDGKMGGPGRECARCIQAGRSCQIARDEEGEPIRTLSCHWCHHRKKKCANADEEEDPRSALIHLPQQRITTSNSTIATPVIIDLLQQLVTGQEQLRDASGEIRASLKELELSSCELRDSVVEIRNCLNVKKAVFQRRHKAVH